MTGAAVAYQAAVQGYNVILLEKKDFGWATSAATSKLIHGGLRYLNNFEFGLVRESLRERRILENIAPNLVKPLPFIIPNYRGDKAGKWVIRTGMLLYDILSFDKKFTWSRSQSIPTHSWLTPGEIKNMEPSVRADNLTGGSMFYDCQSMFPERLTLAFVRSAMKHGARAANYATVTGFLRDSGKKVIGVKVRDDLNGKQYTLSSRITINCGGPWADIVLGLAEGKKGNHQIRRSEGIHIVIRKTVNDHAVIIMTPEGRHLFVIPWRGKSLIGTTDVDYKGDPDKYSVSRESIEGLIRDVNSCFGDGAITIDDVLFSYGGLRPLVEEDTAGTYESSRKYEIYDNADDGLDGLITVEGGKYTTSRNLASTVMELVDKKMKRKKTGPSTDKKYLAGCDVDDMDRFLAGLVSSYPGLPEKSVVYIGKQYGTDAHEILNLASSGKTLARVLSDEGHLAAEALFAVRNEMARTLEDIVFRRTGIGNAGNPGRDAIKTIAAIAGRELGWDKTRIKHETETVLKRFRLPE